MWRVCFRVTGHDEEQHTFDEADAARAFQAGLLEDDVTGLLDDTSLERWDGDRWVPAE